MDSCLHSDAYDVCTQERTDYQIRNPIWRSGSTAELPSYHNKPLNFIEMVCVTRNNWLRIS